MLQFDREKFEMSASNTSLQTGRSLRIVLFVMLAVVILVAAAYLWGNRLNADTLPANPQRLSEASSARFGSSLGISAVRALEAAASRGSRLNGVPAVRAVDQAVNASSSLRLGRVASLATSSPLVRREPGMAPGR
jgi:hypothetical protein